MGPRCCFCCRSSQTDAKRIGPAEIFQIKTGQVYAVGKLASLIGIGLTLVTQHMLQRQPNRMELRSMNSYIQILCRFQKCKRKVPPPPPLFFFLQILAFYPQR